MKSLLLLLAFSSLASGRPGNLRASGACTPTYVEIEGSLKVSVGTWDLSFNLLAVGCKETLLRVWPPDRKKLEKGIALDLQEHHPVQTLFLIREGSPELRKQLSRRLNQILQKPAVYDVFLFDAKAAE